MAGAVPQEAPRSRARCPRRPEASAHPRPAPPALRGRGPLFPLRPTWPSARRGKRSAEALRDPASAPKSEPSPEASQSAGGGRRNLLEPLRTCVRAALQPSAHPALPCAPPTCPSPRPPNVRALPGSPHPEEGGTNAPPGRRSAGVGCVAGPGVQEGASRLAGPQRFVQVLSFGTDAPGAEGPPVPDEGESLRDWGAEQQIRRLGAWGQGAGARRRPGRRRGSGEAESQREAGGWEGLGLPRNRAGAAERGGRCRGRARIRKGCSRECLRRRGVFCSLCGVGLGDKGG